MIPSDIEAHMKKKHIDVFCLAAEKLKLYILVRRMNSASLDRIGKAGFISKPHTCKFKTADNCPSEKRAHWDVAGLVINPYADGLDEMFTKDNLENAQEIWGKESAKTIAFDVDSDAEYLPDGKFYSVITDKSDLRYGCVLFHESGLADRSHGRYIHGDYDLFDLVNQEDQGVGTLSAQLVDDIIWIKSAYFDKVKAFLNRRIRPKMINHPSEFVFLGHPELSRSISVDVFYPDGKTVVNLSTAGEVLSFYQKRFPGRKSIF